MLRDADRGAVATSPPLHQLVRAASASRSRGCNSLSADDVVSAARTPHPARFARHPLPQGERVRIQPLAEVVNGPRVIRGRSLRYAHQSTTTLTLSRTLT